MPKKVEFAFDLDQQVVTPFGEKGLVSLLGFDDGGQCYYVKTRESSNWFKEAQLREHK